LSSHRHRGYSRSLFAFPNLLIHPGLSYMAIHGYNPTYFTSSPANRAPECIMTSSRVHPHNLPRYIHRAYRQMKILSPKTQLRRYCTWRCPISPYLPHPSDSTCSIVFASRSRTYKCSNNAASRNICRELCREEQNVFTRCPAVRTSDLLGHDRPSIETDPERRSYLSQMGSA
jgi:hypothetical protein